MHTLRSGETTFHHHGDFTGKVRIIIPSAGSNYELRHNDHTVTFEVPYRDLEVLVLTKIQRDLVEEIEGIDIATPRGVERILTFMNAAMVAQQNSTRLGPGGQR